MSKTGIKHDQGKVRMELLPMDCLYEVAKVLSYGAEKYGPNNWRKLNKGKERYTGAMLRHLKQMNFDEKMDQETGLSHAAHMACSALFVLYFEMKESEKRQHDREKVDGRKD